jgi:hypothetical protein
VTLRTDAAHGKVSELRGRRKQQRGRGRGSCGRTAVDGTRRAKPVGWEGAPACNHDDSHESRIRAIECFAIILDKRNTTNQHQH